MHIVSVNDQALTLFICRRKFIQNKLTATNQKISGPSVTTNAGHEFCWTTCHNQIADPNSAPKQNECAKCHRVENIRAGQ